MKQTILKSTAVVGIFLVAAVAASAQRGRRIEVSIPFAFTAGRLHVQAGEYSLERISENAVLLRSADNRISGIVMAPTAIRQQREGSPARLVFKRYGSEYFLTQVWTDRDAEGRAVNASPAEQQLAKQQKNSETQTIQIMARRK